MILSRARRAPAPVIALLLGLAAPTGFAPLGLWPLMLACLAGLVLLLERAGSARRAFGIGWWFGLGLFAVGLNWIATAFTFQASMPAWLGWVAVVLLSAYLAVYPALATLGAWALWRAGRRRTPATLATALAATWIVSEYLRATVFTGFAWNPVAAVWAPVPPVARAILPWAGTYGLSGLTVLAAGLAAVAARALVRGERRGPLAGVVLGAASLALAWAAGPRPAPAGGGAPRLRIVQPDIPQDEKWQAGATDRNFAKLVRLTGRPGPEPRLIVWPEVAVPWWIESDAEARAAIASLLGPRDLLLLGAVNVRLDAAGDPVAATNSLYALDARGRLLGRYDKSHLVPYGEYLPMRPLLSAIGLSRLAPGALDFDPGPGPRDVTVPGIGPVGVQICYEVTFSGQVVERARRPRFLLNPSNDAWFGAWGPPQHLAQARLRAIEEGLPVVRATPTGISGIVAADGTLVASLPWRTAGAIEGRLPPALLPTLFSRAGNALPLLLAALLAALAVAGGFARRGGRR